MTGLYLSRALELLDHTKTYGWQEKIGTSFAILSVNLKTVVRGKVMTSRIGLCSFVAVFLFLVIANRALGNQRRLILLTDMEPDDRIALSILAANLQPEEILLAGTSVMNAARKKALARRELNLLGLSKVPVYQGIGGNADSYAEFASTAPARHYTHEGVGILDAKELNELETAQRSSQELQHHLEETLSRFDNLEIQLLSPATDLVEVLTRRPDLRTRIKRIYFMGGFSEVTKDGNTDRRSTYNQNMDLKGRNSSNELFQMKEIPITLLSFHAVKAAFPSRSINPENYPQIISTLRKAENEIPNFTDGATARTSWDKHVLASLPPTLPPTHPLRVALTKHAGSQFAPGDALIVISMFSPNLIKRSRKVSITMDGDDIDPAAGIKVNVLDNPNSNITLVEEIDPREFETVFKSSFESLPKVVAARRLASQDPFAGLAAACGATAIIGK